MCFCVCTPFTWLTTHLTELKETAPFGLSGSLEEALHVARKYAPGQTTVLSRVLGLSSFLVLRTEQAFQIKGETSCLG